MVRTRFAKIIVYVIGWALVIAAPGCHLFNHDAKPQQKDAPRTVSEWMKQPRVQP